MWGVGTESLEGSPGCPNIEGVRVGHGGGPTPELGGQQAPVPIHASLPCSCTAETSV